MCRPLSDEKRRFFFFQAEDGIRDYKVTGVQTCALPICMEVDITLARDASDLFKGLHRPKLVVGVHDGDEHGIGSNGALDVVRVHHSTRADADVADVCPALFERLQGVEDGVMLNGGADDVLRLAARGFDNSDNCGVVRLGAAACEDNLARSGVEEPGHSLASVFHRRPRLLAVPVDGRGVAPVRDEIGLHRFQDFGGERRGGVIIEINSAHGPDFRYGPDFETSSASRVLAPDISAYLTVPGLSNAASSRGCLKTAILGYRMVVNGFALAPTTD